MKPLFLVRLILDFIAASLLLATYAYNGLGNIAHEVIGSAMFALLITHNIFNRRWYARIVKRREARGTISKVITLSLLFTMLSLLVTSVIISQTVFSFLPVATSFTARQAHTLVAYGALLFVALHLGLQWSMIMGLVRGRLGLEANNRLRSWILRVLALGIAAYGVHSLLALNVGSKLLMQVAMGFTDFQVSSPVLLAQHSAVVGLGVCLSHYALKLLSVRRRTAPDAERTPNRAGALPDSIFTNL